MPIPAIHEPHRPATVEDYELLVGMAVKVPETLAHLHSWAVQLTRKATKDEVIEAFRSSSRIALIRMSDGLTAINTVKELRPTSGGLGKISTRSRCGKTW